MTTDSLAVSGPAAERKTRKHRKQKEGKTLSTLLWLNEAEVTRFTGHRIGNSTICSLHTHYNKLCASTATCIACMHKPGFAYINTPLCTLRRPGS